MPPTHRAQSTGSNVQASVLTALVDSLNPNRQKHISLIVVALI